MKKVGYHSFILLSVFLLVSCGKTEEVEKKHYDTATVHSGTLARQDLVLATVEGQNSANISFKSPGRIATMLVKEGDVIVTGQVLATLGNEEGKINYSGVSGILGDIGNMGVNLSEMGGSIDVMRKSVDDLYAERLRLIEDQAKKAGYAREMAQRDLELATSNLSDSTKIFSGSLTASSQKIKQAENALNYAKNNLENGTKLLNTERENVYKNAVNSIANALILSRNAQDYIDTILGMTEGNRQKNDAFENYLGAKDATSKNKSERAFLAFNASYQLTRAYYEENVEGKNDVSPKILVENLSKMLATLELLRTNLHDVKDMLDNSISSTVFPQSVIDTMKGQVTDLMTKTEAVMITPIDSQAMAGVKGSLEGIAKVEDAYNMKLRQLQDAVELANGDLNLAKTGLDTNSSDVTKNTNNLSVAIKMKGDQLELAKIGEQEVVRNAELIRQERKTKLAEIDTKAQEIKSKLRELDAKKNEAGMNKNMASNAIENGTLRAPFSGVVIKKHVDIGTVVAAGTPILSVSTLDSTVIKTYIDNTIYQLKENDIVKIQTEKSEVSFSGKVNNIENIADVARKKNYIEITFSYSGVTIGDRVKVLFGQKQEGNSTLIIPSSAIVSRYSKPGVFVLKDDVVNFQLINVIEMDENNIAISGLKVGDVVITAGKENLVDGEKMK